MKTFFCILLFLSFSFCTRDKELQPQIVKSDYVESASVHRTYDTANYELIQVLWAPGFGQMRISGNHVGDVNAYDTVIVSGTEKNDGYYTVKCANVTYNSSQDYTHFWVSQQTVSEITLSASLTYLPMSGVYPDIDSVTVDSAGTVQRFSQSDYIFADGYEFHELMAGDTITVSSSSNNNGSYEVLEVVYNSCQERTAIRVSPSTVSNEYPTNATYIIE